MAVFPTRVIQYVRSILMLSWRLIKSFRFMASVPSSVSITPVHLPGRERMLRTICVLENYPFCKSLFDLQI